MKKKLLLRFIPLFFTFLFYFHCNAKEYKIPVIKVETTILPNGDIHIVEHRTYRFDGSFSWATYTLPFKGFTKIKDIKVSYQGKNLLENTSEKPGSFWIKHDEKEIEVKWFFNADDETQIYTLSYTLEGAIVAGKQWAEFFWNYISSHRDKKTDTLQIELSLPQNIAADSLTLWSRGPEGKINLQKTSHGYQALALGLNDDEAVKIRLVFPSHLLLPQNSAIYDAHYSLASAQQDEKAYQSRHLLDLQKKKEKARWGKYLLWILTPLSLISFLLLYFKYGQKFPARKYTQGRLLHIPKELKPAEAGWLWSRMINRNLLMATVFDLARRKHFSIQEEEPTQSPTKNKGFFSITTPKKPSFILRVLPTPKEGERLTPWEQAVVDKIAQSTAKGQNRLDKVFGEKPIEAAKWFNQWKKQLETHCKAQKWFDKDSFRGMTISVICQLVFLIGSIVASIWYGPLGLISILLCSFLIFGSLAIIRRSPKGQDLFNQWNAYRKGLKNLKQHQIEPDLLDRHYINAIALMLAPHKVKSMLTAYPPTSMGFHWLLFYNTTSVTHLSEHISTLSHFGSAAGFGGGIGASAGAAGGGAGGGAG